MHTLHLSSPNLSRFYCLDRIHVSFFPKYRRIDVFSQDSIFHSFFKLKCVPPPPYTLCPIQYVCIINLNIFFVLFLVTPPPPIYLLEMTWKQLNSRRAYLGSTSSREFEECLNKAGHHTWMKHRENENRKPVSWNGIRLLLFDKCKFTKPFRRTKSWTRQTTHWSHI